MRGVFPRVAPRRYLMQKTRIAPYTRMVAAVVMIVMYQKIHSNLSAITDARSGSSGSAVSIEATPKVSSKFKMQSSKLPGSRRGPGGRLIFLFALFTLNFELAAPLAD